MPSAFLRLVVSLMAKALAKTRTAQIAGGAGLALAIADVINLDFLNAEALKSAGSSDPAALREAALTAGRLLGLDGSQILWPSTRQTGQLIVPKYMHINLQNGQVWITDAYYSRKMTFLGRGGFGGRGRRWNRFSGSMWRGQGSVNVSQRGG